MFVSKMKYALAGIGAAAVGLMAKADLSAADAAHYTEGLEFGATVPAIAFSFAALVVVLSYAAARHICKKNDEEE